MELCLQTKQTHSHIQTLSTIRRSRMIQFPLNQQLTQWIRHQDHSSQTRSTRMIHHYSTPSSTTTPTARTQNQETRHLQPTQKTTRVTSFRILMRGRGPANPTIPTTLGIQTTFGLHSLSSTGGHKSGTNLGLTFGSLTLGQMSSFLTNSDSQMIQKTPRVREHLKDLRVLVPETLMSHCCHTTVSTSHLSSQKTVHTGLLASLSGQVLVTLISLKIWTTSGQ